MSSTVLDTARRAASIGLERDKAADKSYARSLGDLKLELAAASLSSQLPLDDRKLAEQLLSWLEDDILSEDEASALLDATERLKAASLPPDAPKLEKKIAKERKDLDTLEERITTLKADIAALTATRATLVQMRDELAAAKPDANGLYTFRGEPCTAASRDNTLKAAANGLESFDARLKSLREELRSAQEKQRTFAQQLKSDESTFEGMGARSKRFAEFETGLREDFARVRSEAAATRLNNGIQKLQSLPDTVDYYSDKPTFKAQRDAALEAARAVARQELGNVSSPLVDYADTTQAFFSQVQRVSGPPFVVELTPAASANLDALKTAHDAPLKALLSDLLIAQGVAPEEAKQQAAGLEWKPSVAPK